MRPAGRKRTTSSARRSDALIGWSLCLVAPVAAQPRPPSRTALGRHRSGDRFHQNTADATRAGAGYTSSVRLPFPSARATMSELNRRSFLRASAAGGAFLALPALTYRNALLADDKPSETVRVACV